MRLRGEAREDEPWKILGRGNPNIPAERSADLGAAARAPGLVPRLGVWGGGWARARPRPDPARPDAVDVERQASASGRGAGARRRRHASQSRAVRGSFRASLTATSNQMGSDTVFALMERFWCVDAGAVCHYSGIMMLAPAAFVVCRLHLLPQLLSVTF